MVPNASPPIALAAGAGQGAGTGTDPTAVSRAVAEVAAASAPDGVLVLTDLGSAVLSAEMGLELAGDVGCEVRLSAAPLVEGLTAAVVAATTGADLATADAQACAALVPKQQHIGVAQPEAAAEPTERTDEPGEQSPTQRVPRPGLEPAPSPRSVVEVVLSHPHGLHARPAADFVRAAAGFEADVRVSNLSSGRGPADGRSLISVVALGADRGHRIRIEATGSQADKAVAALRRLVEQ
jgi:phosphotransferase system HPr (HPr) family protein